MEFYSMEQFEIMADAMEEVAEWAEYEADMAAMAEEEGWPEEEPYWDLDMGFDPYAGCYSYDC